MRSTLKYAASVAGILIAASYWLYIKDLEVIELVALKMLPLYKELNPPKDTINVSYLRPGERANIVYCHNLKSDIAFAIKKDGQNHILYDFNFRIRREHLRGLDIVQALLGQHPYATASCSDWLRHPDKQEERQVRNTFPRQQGANLLAARQDTPTLAPPRPLP